MAKQINKQTKQNKTNKQKQTNKQTKQGPCKQEMLLRNWKRDQTTENLLANIL